MRALPKGRREACGAVGLLVRANATVAQAQVGKGNAPGRMKPKRARDAARGEIRRQCAPTGGGIKPLKRGRCGSNAYSAESATH